MCLRWHILISYRFVVEVDFKVLTCSKSRKYCLFSDEEAERKCKLHRCFYCGKLQTKLPRHLSRIHRNEKLVVEAMHFPKKNKERYKKLKEIRCKWEHIRILKLFVTTQQFPSSAELQKPECRIITMRILLWFLQCKKAWWT